MSQPEGRDGPTAETAVPANGTQPGTSGSVSRSESPTSASPTSPSTTSASPASGPAARRRGRPRWLLPVLVALSLGVTAFALLRPKGPSALPVAVVSAKTQTLVKTVNGTGTAYAEVSRTLSFPGTGLVTSVRVKVGDEVTAGQELARLDTANATRELAAARAAQLSAQADLNRAEATAREADADRARQVRSARASVDTAQATLSKAERALQNQRQLLAVGATSVQAVQDAADARSEAARKVEAARSDLSYAQSRGSEGSRAAITQASAALEAANVRKQNLQKALEDAVLTAPAPGVVSAVNVSVGNPAPATQSAIEITDPAQVYLEVPFDETRAASLRAGQPATVQFDALPARSLTGTVSRVDPVARSSGQVASVNVRIRLPDARDVKPGFTGTATVTTRRLRGAVVIPLETVTEEDGKTRVWVVTPATSAAGSGASSDAAASGVAAGSSRAKVVGTVKPVDITIIDRNASLAAVQGLKSGDMVLTPAPALDSVKEGQQVTYTRQEAAKSTP